MERLTLRVSEDLAAALRTAAAASGRSLNAWATAVLRAAVAPDLATDEAERVRGRLRRAGLLADLPQRRIQRPDPDQVARARDAAGAGRSLAELVAEGRG